MLDFIKRHKFVHIWTLGVLALFCCYWYGVSSPEAANAVSGATQIVKDSYARFWYLFPFSVVEWFYVLFILGMIAWAAVLLHRVRTRRGHRADAAYGCAVGMACLGLTAYGLYCLLWGVNYYAAGFQEKSGLYAQPVKVEELDRVASWFAQRLSDTAGQVERDSDGVFAVPRDEIFQASTGIYSNISREFPFLDRQDRIPKKMYFSRLFSAMNFTGFYSPYTGESSRSAISWRLPRQPHQTTAPTNTPAISWATSI